MSRCLAIAIFVGAVACGPPRAAKKSAPPELGDTHVMATPPHEVEWVSPKPDAAPTPLDEDLPRLAASWSAMYQDLALALAGTGANCADAITKLGELEARYAVIATTNAQVIAAGRGAALHTAIAPLDAQIGTALDSIAHSQAVTSCASDPRFTTVLDRLVGARP